MLANRTLTTTRTFSSNGARMLTETNPMGFTSAYSYNDETGLLHSVADPNGLITVSNYDFMGRKVGETLPDGNIIEKSSGWSEGQSDAPNDTTIFYTYEAQTGKTTTYTYFNNKNLKIRDVTFGLNNDKKYTDYVYDQNGRLIKEYQPYFADSTRNENRCTNHQYDIHGRVVKSILPDGTFLRKSYNGRIDSTFTGITKEGTEHILRTTVTKKNAYDLPEYEIDSEGDKVVFNYDPRGNLIETYVDGQETETKNVYGYNRMGIRNMMKNNASDTAYAEFNSMGKILWLKDPLGNEIVYEYDKLGRNTEHSIKPGGIPTSVGILMVQYAYDEQKKGMLASISGSGHTQSFSYDDHCRIARTTETYPGLDETYTKDYGFDKFGRQNLETFSDYGVTIENKYHPESGALIEVGTNIGGTFTSAWKATADDELGNITDWNTGNNTIPVNKTVELESGNITEIDYGYGSGSLYNIEYDYYDDRNFKMRKHTFGSTTQTEYYAFDKMKQLIYSGPSQTIAEQTNWDEDTTAIFSNQTIRYDDFGQKTYIEGICAPGTTIQYDADGHIANPDSLITDNPLFRKNQFIRYNSRNRVESFQLDDDSLTFSYRPDTTKWETKYYENGTLKYTKYHFGNHEKFVYPNGDTKNLFYIFGGKELTGLYIKENSSGQMGYVISDHLGSVWALANDQGSFIEQYAYDPWGRRMDPTDWSTPDTTRTEFRTDRGFTLHEHYDHMQIVNMNARMYDPLMGQFISVDPLADKYPGWGGYVYCMNNPLLYLDPDGEEVWKHTEGNTTTLVFNIAVNNSGGFSDKDVKKWSNSIKSQIVESFTDYDVNTKQHYKAIVNMDYKSDKANSGTYTMDFVKKVTGSPERAIGRMDGEFGNTKTNNMQIEAPGMPNGAHEEQTEKTVGRTGAHEVGHTGNLKHPGSEDNPNKMGKLPDNLMWQSWDKWSGTQLCDGQLDEFSKHVQEVDPNDPNLSEEGRRVLEELENN